MKIAITSTQADLAAKVDPRFGRCPYFLIVETDDFSFEAIENPSVTLGSGAGIQAAQLMAEKGVKHVLTGNCGPNAHQTLAAAGIGVIVGCSGSVRDVIEQYKSGQMSIANEPNVISHFGMGATSAQMPGQPNATAPAFGPGGGSGGGRGMGGGGRGMGMGRGGGRGMGGGMGRGRGMGAGGGLTGNPLPPSGSSEDELTVLKQQAEAMSRQMQQIQQRIEELEKEKHNGR